jgi:aminopeptidase N
MAQTVRITVPKAYKTLSNGDLLYSSENPNGTRTDVWEQKLPHAPYLAMLAVGDFAVIEDKWRDKELLYYVEPAFKDDAKMIFNHTAEMLEFFSKTLGVDYPWEKFAQVVVRNYVSGAMENTGAVVFGEFIQHHKKRLIDDPNDGIVSHEMFHHWFGDLVTAESWSNLALNESFATYSDILWQTYKYGDLAGQSAAMDNADSYFRESRYKQVPIIRFFYDNPDAMFDSHSYSKGSRVLHMLRNEIGDQAFFLGLKTYLSRFAHKSAEMHDLRLIFEEITGKDLNWFFNQWFYGSGHPTLDIQHSANDSTHFLSLSIAQRQAKVFQLHTNVSIITDSGEVSVPIIVDSKNKNFTIPYHGKLIHANVDPQRILLAERIEKLNPKQMADRLLLYPNSFASMIESMSGFSKSNSPKMKMAVLAALNNSYFELRLAALSFLGNWATDQDVQSTLVKLATKDASGKVRANALAILTDKKHVDSKKLVQDALRSDSSIYVQRTGLQSLVKIDSVLALSQAKAMSNDLDLMPQCAKILSQLGSQEDTTTFFKMLKSCNGKDKNEIGESLADFALQYDLRMIRYVGLFFKNHDMTKGKTGRRKRNGGHSRLISFLKNSLEKTNNSLSNPKLDAKEKASLEAKKLELQNVFLELSN